MGRKYVFWGLVIVWMMMIFSLSSDDGDTSSYKSKQVTVVVQQAARKVSENIKQVSSIKYVSEHIVRKIGHVMEYFLLTILVIIASVISRKGSRRVFVNAVLLPLLFAISDELHQLYTPGRGPQITDVAIDAIGILAAIGVAFGLTVVFNMYRRFEEEKS